MVINFGNHLDIKARLCDLEKKIEFFSQSNFILEKQNIELKEQIAKFQTRISELTAENLSLKEKLGLNSKNSSIPPSKDLYKLKKNNRKKSERKQGAQEGHKGYKREVLEASQIVKIEINDKCECGGRISLGKPRIHQKIDLPEIKPHVTNYHIERGRCLSCNKRKSGSLPVGVQPDLFGPRIKAVIGSLSGFYKNSKRDVEAILKDIFNVRISLGTISNNEERISKKCQASYENIELELSYAPLLQIDETSHYKKGKLGWCWGFFSEKASLIKLADSRGKRVLKDSVFGAKDQIITSDRYAVYNYFAEENRQICWAHLRRDFERFANSSHNEIKRIGEYLGLVACELFGLKKALSDEKIDAWRFLRRVRILRKRTWRYLKNLSYLQNAKQATRIAKNMMKSENMMWKFMDNPEFIPLTNNHAEQQLRHYVTYRKNSYFVQSERGERFLERIISLYLTSKKQQQNPVSILQNLIAA